MNLGWDPELNLRHQNHPHYKPDTEHPQDLRNHHHTYRQNCSLRPRLWNSFGRYPGFGHLNIHSTSIRFPSVNEWFVKLACACYLHPHNRHGHPHPSLTLMRRKTSNHVPKKLRYADVANEWILLLFGRFFTLTRFIFWIPTFRHEKREVWSVSIDVPVLIPFGVQKRIFQQISEMFVAYTETSHVGDTQHSIWRP